MLTTRNREYRHCDVGNLVWTLPAVSSKIAVKIETIEAA